MSKRDYYEVLGISKDSTKDDIKSTYRKLALEFHPDRNKSPEAEERFKEISEAYAILSDDEKRKQYDMYGHAGIGEKYTQEDIFRGANFDEVFRNSGFGVGGFDNIFDIFFGRQRVNRYGPQRGNDLRHDMDITLEEVASGVETEINVPRTENCSVCHGSGARSGTSPKRCPQCQGTGRVERVRSTGFARLIQVETCNICSGKGMIVESPCLECRGAGVVSTTRKIKVRVPPGIDDGGVLRLSGEGDAGSRGGPPGDLYVYIHSRPHNLFQRRDDDLFHEASVSFTQAALGEEIEVPTIDGKAKLRIPSGTQTGTVFRLRGKGMPRLRAFGRGDELVRVNIQTPTKLTPRQKDLLTELAKEMDEEAKQKKSFFGKI
ncbi:MAG: molecular chaperone DnaJ [Thermoproteota archaeon]|nr:molecular chaperone DnaJ [Thermoproteota archaeon]